MTFASQGSAHDQFYFRRKIEMIAGAVAPPRLDLTNQELVQAHLHSVWLSVCGIGLDTSIGEVLNLDAPDLPLNDEIAAKVASTPASIYMAKGQVAFLVVKQVFTNKDGSTSVRYLVTSDLTLEFSGTTTI